MAKYLAGRNPLFSGEPPPEWEPLPIRPGWLALVVTAIAVVAIVLLMLFMLPGGKATESPSPLSAEERPLGMVTEEVEPERSGWATALHMAETRSRSSVATLRLVT